MTPRRNGESLEDFRRRVAMEWRRQVNKERVNSLADAANSILNLGESIAGGKSVLYPPEVNLNDYR